MGNVLFLETQIIYDDSEYLKQLDIYNYYQRVYKPSDDASNCFARFLSRITEVVKNIIGDSIYDYDRENNDICHYTRIDSLRELISYKEGTAFPKLRLSNVAYMNDPSEGRILVDILDELSKTKVLHSLFGFGQPSCQKREELYLSNVYIGSFSTAINNLPMWTLYGDDSKGCCLVLDDDYFIKMLQNEDVTQVAGSDIMLCKVHYTDINSFKSLKMYNDLADLAYVIDDQSSLVLSDDTIKKWVIDKLESIRFLFKNKDYEYEKEIRIICHPKPYEIKIEDTFLVPKLFFYINQPVSYKEVILGSKIEKPSDISPFLLQSKSVNRVSKSGIEYQ